MRSSRKLVALALTAAAGTMACSSDSPLESPVISMRVVDQNVAATLDYHVGDAFLAEIDPSLSPAVAMAENGDKIALNGTGELSIHPKSATGEGTFEHTDAEGQVVGSGGWEATELVSFRSYGPSPDAGFPPEFEAGVALVRVHLTPDGGGPGFDAVLRVTCVLPGIKLPPSLHEGIRLAIEGVINFNHEAGGGTVFVRQ